MKANSELKNIIKNRRNTKNFNNKNISNEDINSLLDVAIWAPNHRNTEPWRFFVIKKDSEIKNKIADGIIEIQNNINKLDLSEKQKNKIHEEVRNYPCLIFVFSLEDENEEISEENYGATCCAIQNIQLMATSLGLGVGWSTGKIAKINGISEILGIEEQVKIVGVLTIGYSDTVKTKSRTSHKKLTKWL